MQPIIRGRSSRSCWCLLERLPLLWDFALLLVLRWRASSLMAALSRSCPILVRLTLGCRRPFFWYGDDLSLYTTHSFPELYFDGNNVGIEMTASCPSSGTFIVSLYRVVNGRGTLVGSASFKRKGFTKATWEGVGSGTYRFVCKKPADGKLVTSSDVAMYSW